MRTTRQIFASACTAILLSIPSAVAGSPAARVFESASSHAGTILISGGSNVKDWEVRGTEIRGTIWLTPSADGMDSPPVEAGGEVRIPVQSLTGGSRGMDRRMLEALEADRYPHIDFALSTIEANPLAESEDPPLLARGELRIRNRRRTVAVPMRIKQTEAGIRLTGAKRIRMTDYGIDPPRALLGALRTDDDVTVNFEWSLNERSP